MFNDDKPLLNIPVGETRTINAVGDYIHILEASEAVAVTAANTTQGVKSGTMKIQPNGGRRLTEKCNQWTIKNIGAVAQNILVSIGSGQILDPSINLAADVVISKPSNFEDKDDVSLVAGAAVSVIGSGIAKEVMISAFETNTDVVRIGSSLVNDTRGIRLAAGATLMLDTSAELFAFCSVAAKISVSWSA